MPRTTLQISSIFDNSEAQTKRVLKMPTMQVEVAKSTSNRQLPVNSFTRSDTIVDLTASRQVHL